MKAQAERLHTAIAAVGARLDEAVSLAQAVMGLSGASGAVGAVGALSSSVAGPAAVAPLHAHTGDPQRPSQGGPDEVSAFRGELKGADDGDVTRGRAQRAGRAMIRNMSDIAEQSKTTAKAAYSQIAEIDPPGESGTYAYIKVADPPQLAYRPAIAYATPEDTVGSLVVMAVVVAEGFARFMRRLKGRHNA